MSNYQFNYFKTEMQNAKLTKADTNSKQFFIY